MTRDFVRAFLIGQVQAGKKIEEAQVSFIAYLDSIRDLSSEDKGKIIDDLPSYQV